MSTFAFTLSDADVARIAQAVAALVERQSPAGWLTIRAASEYSSLTEEALRTSIKRGKLRAHRGESGRLMIRVEDLDAFLTS